MSSIQIVALVTVKPEYTEVLAAQFKELVKASRAEEGNISYDLHQEMPANISKTSSNPSKEKPKHWKSS